MTETNCDPWNDQFSAALIAGRPFDDTPMMWRTRCSVDLYVALLSRTFASVLLTTSYKQLAHCYDVL